MSPPDMKKAGSRGNGNQPKTVAYQATNNTTPIVDRIADKSTTYIAIIGRAYAPAGRRRLWVSVVERCPFCGGSHLHRGTANGPVSGVKAAGCCRRTYFIVAKYLKGVSR